MPPAVLYVFGIQDCYTPWNVCCADIISFSPRPAWNLRCWLCCCFVSTPLVVLKDCRPCRQSSQWTPSSTKFRHTRHFSFYGSVYPMLPGNSKLKTEPLIWFNKWTEHMDYKATLGCYEEQKQHSLLKTACTENIGLPHEAFGEAWSLD